MRPFLRLPFRNGIASLAAAASFLGLLRADTVTLSPASGTTTNALALYVGSTAVEIAGPGTVRLNPGNIHTGGTTLTGGTLELSGDIAAGLPSPVGMGAFTVSGGTLLGSGTFGGDINGTGTFRIEAPDGWTLTGNNAFGDRVDLVDGSLTIADGTVTLDAKHFQLSPTNNANTIFAMTGGAFNANGKRIIAGFRSTYATNVTDISGTAAVTNSEYCYVYEGAGNYWSLNVHDGGLFATLGSLYANGSGAVMDISVSQGGRVNATNITSKSGSTTTVSVTDGGILGIAGAIEAKGTTALSIDGGIVRNDASPSGNNNYFQFFQANADGNIGPTVAIGPQGAMFRGGGKTAKYAQLYKDMSAIPAGAGETAQGVTFDGGNWAYYTTQSYEGPTVLENGAALFLAKNGYLPDDSVVTVGAGCQLRSGSTQKTVASLTLGEDAVLGFANTLCALNVTGSITLPASAKIALYSENTPATGTKNTAGTYTVLQVPVAYADALRAVKWSSATPASGKVYSFSVATSGSTATLSMTIADASSAEDAAATSGGTMAVSGNLNVDSVIDVRGTLTVSGHVYGAAENESAHTLTIHDGGTLEVRNGTIRPVSSAGYFFDLYLEEGGSIIVRSIEDAASLRDTNQTGPYMFHFNGGTIYPVGLNSSDGNRFYLNYQPATIGEHGLTIDLAKWKRPEGYVWYLNGVAYEWVRASVQGHVDHDPDCAGPDGGITVRGIKGDKSMVLFGGRFGGSTLTGGIRAEDGATVGATSSSLSGQTLSLAPGSRFRPYNSSSTVSIGNLTLGEAGATEPVVLDGSSCTTNFNIVVTGTLSVLSPVAFSVTMDWYRDSTLSAGTYTALVYQASCSVDPSLFQLPAGTTGHTLSAQEVNLTSGDYAGWKALVCKIAQDNIVVNGSTVYPTPLMVSTDASCGSIVVGGTWNGATDPVCDTSLTVSGDITATTGLYLGYDPALGADATTGAHQGFLTLDGGTITTPVFYSVYRPNKGNNDSDCRFGGEVTVNDGLLDVAGDVRFGNNRTRYGDKLYSNLTVNDGRVAVGGKFYLLYCTISGAYTAPGSIVLNGGEVDVAGLIDLARNTQKPNAACKAYDEKFGIWLNGGVLKAENIMMTANATSPKVVFNGGTYAPYGKAAANRTMENLNKCYISAGGAIVSTENLPAGETYTIAQPLLTDPALSGAADGGLVKKGAGVLELTGANTFSGPVRVERGGLIAGSANALSASLAVANGAGLYADGADLSFEDVAASGTIKADSVTVTKTLSLAGEGSVLSVDGDLTLARGVAIDFEALDVVPAGWTPVAAASGAVTVPDTIHARHAGEKTHCGTMVADGVLYVTPTCPGFILFVR